MRERETLGDSLVFNICTKAQSKQILQYLFHPSDNRHERERERAECSYDKIRLQKYWSERAEYHRVQHRY